MLAEHFPCRLGHLVRPIAPQSLGRRGVVDNHRTVVAGPAHVSFHREAVIGRRGEGLKGLQRILLVAAAVSEDVRTGWSSAVEVFDGLPDGAVVAEGGFEADGELPRRGVAVRWPGSRVKYHPATPTVPAKRSR